MDLITVIVPCFNEEASLPYFFSAFEQLKKAMSSVAFELLFVDDGSKDSTLSIIKQLAVEHDEVEYISFSRNFGKEAAMYAGLRHARGDYVVFMDADLQDPPSLLPDMYKAVSEEGYDSAATRRVTRAGEPPNPFVFCTALLSVDEPDFPYRIGRWGQGLSTYEPEICERAP